MIKKNKKFFKVDLFIVLKDIWKNLRTRKKKYCFYIWILMIVSALLESFTLFSIVPLLSRIILSNNANDNFLLKRILNFAPTENTIFYLFFLFILLVISSSILRLLNLRFSTKLAASIGNDFSKEALEIILYQPYIKHIKRNSSELIKTLTTEITQTVTVISSTLFILTSSILCFSLFTTLFFIDWKVAFITIFLFTSCYLSIGILLKPILRINSFKTSQLRENEIKIIQESLGGIRSVIINKLQPYYLDTFIRNDKELRNINADNEFISNFPRYLLEVVGIIFFLSFALILNNRGDNIINNLSLVGTFVFASQRILPAIQQIFSRWAVINTNIKASMNVLEIINDKNNIHLKSNSHTKLISFNSIEFQNINFKYRSEENFCLQNINLKINQGDVVGICGKTGSGKSTFIDILMGLLHPTKGIIKIDEQDINLRKNTNKLNKWQNSIANVPQDIFLTDSTIAQNIAQGKILKEIDYEKLKFCAQQAQLSNFIEKLPLKYKTFVGEKGVRLSGGQKQRIGIARALYKGTTIMILDEATSALDYKTENEVMNSIYSLGCNITIIIIAHRLSTLRKCKYIINFDNGKIRQIINPQDSPKLFD